MKFAFLGTIVPLHRAMPNMPRQSAAILSNNLKNNSMGRKVGEEDDLIVESVERFLRRQGAKCTQIQPN